MALFGGYLVIAFVLSPILIRGLGNRDYGIWEISLSLLSYFRILDLGLGPALVRFVAAAQGAGDRTRMTAIHQSSVAVLGLVGVVNLALFAILSRFAEPVFNVAPGDVAGLPTLVLLAGASLSVQFAGIPSLAFLQGLQRHYQVNAIRLTVYVIQSAGYYWVATDPDSPGVAGLALFLFAGNVVEYGIYTVLAFRSGYTRLAPWSISGPLLRELYGFGFRSLTLMVADRLRKWSMPIVIAQMVGVGHVVFFTQPAKLVDYAFTLTAYLRQPLMPYFSAVSGQRDRTATRQAWFSMSRAMQFPALWLALAIFFLGTPFLHRWLGEEYAREGYLIIRILSVSLMIEAVAATAGTMLVSLGRHGPAAKASLLLAVVGVAGAVPLAGMYGIAGAALVLAVVNGVTAVVFLGMASRELDTTPLAFLRGTAARLAAPLACAGVASALAARTFPPVGYGDLVIHAGIGAIIYVAVAWRLSFSTQERGRLMAALQRRS